MHTKDKNHKYSSIAGASPSDVLELSGRAVENYFKEQSHLFNINILNNTTQDLWAQRLRDKKLSLDLESDQSKNFDPSSLLQDYRSPDPTLSKL